MKETIKFQFPHVVRPDEVEDDLALAIFTAQCVHGRPQTRLQVGYQVADEGRRATLEVDGPAGEMTLRVFLGLCGARFGEDGFQVRRSASVEEWADA